MSRSESTNTSRFVDISADDWNQVGINLAKQVALKTVKAFASDFVVHEDDEEMITLWTQLANGARQAMQKFTPNVHALATGFDEGFKLVSKLDVFSVWKLLTLYEMDMFLHSFHYQCGTCSKRIRSVPRLVCGQCESVVTKGESKAQRKLRIAKSSYCGSCQTPSSPCPVCAGPLLASAVLHETSPASSANTSGCTGFALRGWAGQTCEMDEDTYNYGRQDTVYRLRVAGGQAVLLYDVGCILSPIGLNASGLSLNVYNLYNADGRFPLGAEEVARLPMASLQWETLLRGASSEKISSVRESAEWLRSVILEVGTFTAGSIVLTTQSELAVLEIGASQLWVELEPNLLLCTPPADTETLDVSGLNESCLVRANHCMSAVSPLMSSQILPRNASSPRRAADLFASIVAHLKSTSKGEGEWARSALSSAVIQTDSALATIIAEPATKKLWVRFRVGTRISSTLRNGQWTEFSL